MATKAILNNHGINRVIENILKIAEQDDFFDKKKMLDETNSAGLDRVFFVRPPNQRTN